MSRPKIMPYAEKLSIAHERGLIGIETEIERIEWEDKSQGKIALVVCVATAFMRDPDGGEPRKFRSHGDASPFEIGTNKKPIQAGTPAFDTPIRMAETRAKARALLDAINRGEEVDHETQAPEPEMANPQQVERIKELAEKVVKGGYPALKKTKLMGGKDASELSDDVAAYVIMGLSKRLPEDKSENGEANPDEEDVDIDDVPGLQKGVPA
jgi:hypothetical protein